MRLRRMLLLLSIVLLITVGSAYLPSWAQEESSSIQLPELLLFADYPSRVIDIGEVVTLDLKLRTDSTPQLAELAIENLPEAWRATFRGDGQIINSAFVLPGTDSTVQLQIEPPPDIEPGSYRFTALARSDDAESVLPVELTVQERVPSSLEFDVELPMVRGRPNTTFRFNTTLRNEGDEDLTVDLLAQSPPAFTVVFKSGGQEVTSVPIEANGSERISVEVSSLVNLVPAGVYPVTVRAQSGEVETSTELAVEVVGQPSLSLVTPDERLSGDAEAGVETTYSFILHNNGSAPARNITVSSTSPSGWTVNFEPEEIEAIEPGQFAEITARMRPSEKAIAGDYMVTFRAQPEGGSSETLEYRVTVRTSTVWGAAGVALIAVAVGAVGLAVARFGRR